MKIASSRSRMRVDPIVSEWNLKKALLNEQCSYSSAYILSKLESRHLVFLHLRERAALNSLHGQNHSRPRKLKTENSLRLTDP